LLSEGRPGRAACADHRGRAVRAGAMAPAQRFLPVIRMTNPQ
jgi:hypothetical protein